MLSLHYTYARIEVTCCGVAEIEEVQMTDPSFKKGHRERSSLCLILVVFLCFSGCSHRLEVKNMSMYKPIHLGSVAQDLKIGIKASAITPEEERLLIAVVNSLKQNGFFVVYPYYSQSNPESNLDYVVGISFSSQYRGSGWNFLINWPGFIIWTPAWHGYNYRVVYEFDVSIHDVKNQKDLPTLAVPVDLDIRHAAMNRTWTEISWLEWSVIALIGGFVFTRYDNSVTPQLLDFAEYKIGDYVGSKITAAIASTQAGVRMEALPLEAPI